MSKKKPLYEDCKDAKEVPDSDIEAIEEFLKKNKKSVLLRNF